MLKKKGEEEEGPLLFLFLFFRLSYSYYAAYIVYYLAPHLFSPSPIPSFSPLFSSLACSLTLLIYSAQEGQKRRGRWKLIQIESSQRTSAAAEKEREREDFIFNKISRSRSIEELGCFFFLSFFPFNEQQTGSMWLVRSCSPGGSSQEVELFRVIQTEGRNRCGARIAVRQGGQQQEKSSPTEGAPLSAHHHVMKECQKEEDRGCDKPQQQREGK